MAESVIKGVLKDLIQKYPVELFVGSLPFSFIATALLSIQNNICVGLAPIAIPIMTGINMVYQHYRRIKNAMKSRRQK